MNTPICDFVTEYANSKKVRAHMPGHKGEKRLGLEHLDITEVFGADSLFEASSIIKSSEENAGSLFGAHTYYSTEGSSLSIRAMLYLALLYAKKKGKAELVLAARNVHKSFVSALALLDFSVEWLYNEESNYLSCRVDAKALDKKLSEMATKPVAFYLTSPDYLGNVADIKSIADVCLKHDVLLLVDNAHGAYLKFLSKSEHPIDLGATMCCDSAHKTLSVLTGGAYLHISKTADSIFKDKAKNALSLFASTSPSYLILQSLDMANKILANDYKESLNAFVKEVDALKCSLTENGYTLVGNEKLKITIATKDYGYMGNRFADILRENNIECEFSDPDFVVLMLTPSLSKKALLKIKTTLLAIKKLEEITDKPPKLFIPKKVMSVRDAVMSNSTTVNALESCGKILSTITVSCPPAVVILVSGEKIDENLIDIFKYYSIKTCEVVE